MRPRSINTTRAMASLLTLALALLAAGSLVIVASIGGRTSSVGGGDTSGIAPRAAGRTSSGPLTLPAPVPERALAPGPSDAVLAIAQLVPSALEVSTGTPSAELGTPRRPVAPPARAEPGDTSEPDDGWRGRANRPVARSKQAAKANRADRGYGRKNSARFAARTHARGNGTVAARTHGRAPKAARAKGYRANGPSAQAKARGPKAKSPRSSYGKHSGKR